MHPSLKYYSSCPLPQKGGSRTRTGREKGNKDDQRYDEALRLGCFSLTKGN